VFEQQQQIDAHPEIDLQLLLDRLALAFLRENQLQDFLCQVNP